MKLMSIVVDGFKSYARRTTIAGFDPSFNAITGRNGSGKSNILDAICFVLGISNLSQVCRVGTRGDVVAALMCVCACSCVCVLLLFRFVPATSKSWCTSKAKQASPRRLLASHLTIRTRNRAL